MKNKLDHIHLIGNSEENFYQLGLRDKNAFTEVYLQISMLCMRNNFMAKIIKSTTDFARSFVNKNTSLNMRDLKAYAEGLEQPIDKVLFAFLLPEMVASFNKWAPDLLSLIPGCSSLFLWDKEAKGIVHGRILDYALNGPFENNERSVLYDFSGRNKIYSFTSAGIAFPSLSSMNEHGLTVALHYKHGDHFNLKGESIFFIVNDILSYTSNIREAIKLLREKESISFWGLYLSDKNGEVAAIDICGNQMHQEKFQIQDHDYLYFNNRALLHKNASESMQPFGNLDQCKMRASTVDSYFKKKTYKVEKDRMLQGLKVLGSPKPIKADGASKWKLPTITPSSIQLYSFHNTKKEAYFVTGDGPKFFTGNYIELTNIFTAEKQKIKESSVKHVQFQQANKNLSLYQTSIDTNKIAKAYHHIQMAIEQFEGVEEKYIAQFYYCITQYIYEGDKRELSYLFDDFLALTGKLPTYLEDHRLLFELRLQKILGYKVKNQSKKVQNKNLKSIYKDELKLSPIGIKGLKNLIFPRIDVMDIVYAY
jgi:hypothetical protein